MILSMTYAGEVTLTVFLFIVGLFLIIKGGDWFVDSASKIAEITGVPQFIIGATIVSIGTTLPELITSAIAAAEGNVDIAIGNAVGSVNANIGLIMAISLLFMPHPFDKKTYLFKGLTMITATVVLFLISLKGEMNAYLSIILLVIFVIFMIENIVSGKKMLAKPAQPDNNGLKPAVVEIDEAKMAEEKFDEETGTTEKSAANSKKERTKIIVKSIIMFIVGAAFIVGGAQHLVTFGSKLAGYMHIPERIVAITLVAIGTSLPELVTTITSIAKKKHDLSIGNIIGANIIDLCMILPICAMITGGVLTVPHNSLYIDMPFCIGFSALAILPGLIFKKFTRTQGAALLCAYIAYMTVSIVL